MRSGSQSGSCKNRKEPFLIPLRSLSSLFLYQSNSVPSFKVYDHQDNQIYLIHQPTCCGGCCVNCCAEGNPCGKGCCKQSFRVYDADQSSTGGDAPYKGMIMKKPKSLATELFTDAEAFEVKFPEDANADQKGILIGAAIFINSLFYEGQGDDDSA